MYIMLTMFFKVLRRVDLSLIPSFLSASFRKMNAFVLHLSPSSVDVIFLKNYFFLHKMLYMTDRKSTRGSLRLQSERDYF